VGRPRLVRPLSADRPSTTNLCWDVLPRQCHTLRRSPGRCTHCLAGDAGAPALKLRVYIDAPAQVGFASSQCCETSGLPRGNAAGWNSRRPVKGVATRAEDPSLNQHRNRVQGLLIVGGSQGFKEAPTMRRED
jgi:hypothetical protein